MYDLLFTTPEMSAALSGEAFIAEMLRFEVALSLALEANGITPPGTAEALEQITLTASDHLTLRQQASLTGNICIPFVKLIMERVESIQAETAPYVHWGATSQDAIDTALLLQLREALALVERDLDSTCRALAGKIRQYRNLVIAGRTWLQQGPPTTLGLKLATWLDALHRHSQRISQMKPRVFALQFGGAVGTLAPLGLHGRKVAEGIAKRLKVEMPAVPWHTQRDRMAEMGCVLAMLVGTLGKMGRDVSLLMQSEVREFFEPDGEGRGGSSTMPHKRNPISSAILLSAATRVPGLVAALLSAAVQEHERGLGGWHAEWETMTEVFRLAGGAMHHALGIAEGGSADAAAMKRNLDLLGGVPMAEAVSYAVAAKLGKMRAHGILEKASRRAVSRNTSMRTEIEADSELMGVLTAEKITALLDPKNYLGSANQFIDAVLANEEARTSYAVH